MGDTGKTSGAPESLGDPAPRPGSRWGGRRSQAEICAEAAARQALDSLYYTHYQSLVRLAALLTGDVALAEEVVAESLIASISWSLGMRLPERELLQLRQQVVVRSRRVVHIERASRRRHPGRESVDTRAPVAGWKASPAIRVLGSLSSSQREAVVLRHYLDLTEQETAAVMGASLRAVRRSLDGATEALQAVMPEGPLTG
jgi:DNA-directed RNA polymerase specialized sigma24 family protein